MCCTCGVSIGAVDPSTQGYSLRKLHLQLSTGPNDSPKLAKQGQWLACLLLCAMETQGVRKFVVSRPDGKTLKLWVFTPDLIVSSSAMERKGPARYMKVLWQESDVVVGNSERLNAAALAEGELKLQDDEPAMLEESLKLGSLLLPESARRFQDWNVGLLERFRIEDVKP